VRTHSGWKAGRGEAADGSGTGSLRSAVRARQPQLAERLAEWGAHLARQGDTADAVRLLKTSIELREGTSAEDAAVAEAYSHLLELVWSTGQAAEGEPYFHRWVRQLLTRSKETGGRHPLLVRATFAWTACLGAMGKTPEEIARACDTLFAELGLEQLTPEVLAEITSAAQSQTQH
jgi:hypothetical protein